MISGEVDVDMVTVALSDGKDCCAEDRIRRWESIELYSDSSFQKEAVE